jgi:hypothetical protein
VYDKELAQYAQNIRSAGSQTHYEGITVQGKYPDGTPSEFTARATTDGTPLITLGRSGGFLKFTANVAEAIRWITTGSTR